jgi:two-component system cell cycle response regulator
MKQSLLKALVMLDNRENSWFLNAGLHESVDCHLIDVRGLRVNMEDLHGTLCKVAEQAPDVLMLDSTLARHIMLGIAVQVRDKMPNLPILLLPNIHDAVDRLEDPPATVGHQSPPSARPDGARVTSDVIARTLRYTHGRLGLQRTLLQMALRDDLTGLHNRRGFMALATQHLRWARDTGEHMQMFFADLDGLKSINDRFGHGEGDRAISLAAACIKQTFRKSDVTARLSGDEFVALIHEEPGQSSEAICQRLQTNLAACAGAETRYRLSLSVGVAHFDPDKPVTLQELMRHADVALYRHKRKDRSTVADGLTAAHSQAPARVEGTVKRPVLGESTAAPTNHRWRSAAPLGLNQSRNPA